MLISRSLLRAAPTRITQPGVIKPLAISHTSQFLRYKSDQSNRNKGVSFKSPRDLQYDPSKRLRAQQRKHDALSEETAELDAGATQHRNTVPTSQPGPSTPERVVRDEMGRKDWDGAQEEFNSRHSPRANTAPSSQPSEPSREPFEAVEEPVQEKPRGPLPDLRQGIPSTFAEEFLNKKATSTPEEADSTAQQDPNITDDPRVNTEGPGDGAGRDQGELPRSAYQTSIDKRREAMAKWMYIAMAAFLTTGAVYAGRNWDTEAEERAHPDAPSGWSFQLFYERIKARLGNQMGYYTEPTFPKLLPDMDPAPPYTLVLSLEDMLVHSEWTREHGWRTAKRPGVDYFLGYLSQYYELVLFTTLPMAYADQIIKKLDPYHFITWPLFREGTRYEKGKYIKDLSYLNRPLSKTIIIDSKAEHVKNQPENAILLKPWEGERSDKELVELIPYLEHIAAIGVPDVRKSLTAFEGKHIPTEFATRLQRAREEFNKQLEADRAKKPKRSAGSAMAGFLGIKPQGGMTYDGTTRVADEAAQGKMLADQIRENGIRQYQRIEKEIRENGEMWIKQEQEMEKKMMAEQMKGIQKGYLDFFGGGGKGGDAGASPSAV